uniref:Capsid protein n=1 Tax=Mastomys rat circovirus TaxID=3141884 RepID=A0AAU7E2Q8_9CIRC
MKFTQHSSFWVSQVPDGYTKDKVKNKEMDAFFEWWENHWQWNFQDHVRDTIPPNALFQAYKIRKAKLIIIPHRTDGTNFQMDGFSYIDRVNLPLPGKSPHWETNKWFPEGQNHYTKKHWNSCRYHSRIFRPTPMITMEKHADVVPSIGVPAFENWYSFKKSPWITIDDWYVPHLGLWTKLSLDGMNSLNPPTKDEGDDFTYIHNPLKTRFNVQSTIYITFRGQL